MKRERKKKETRANDPSKVGNSRYAKKRVYLARMSLWGWEVGEPKPWR